MSGNNNARVRVASGDDLDVRSFSVRQGMSQLFEIELSVVSSNLDVDFDAVIGNAASFSLETRRSHMAWSGICREMEQHRVEEAGLATYRLLLVPQLWLLSQRKNYRVFQYKSELEIVRQILGEWGIEHDARVDGGAHGKRKFRVQYGESDFTFISRMMEDAGISYFFEPSDGGTKLVLADEPQTGELAHAGIPYEDEPGTTVERFVTRVAVSSKLRPGKMTIGDLDYRRDSTNQPRATFTAGLAHESALEQFDYEPGAFLYTASGDGSTPAADDRGASRTDEEQGARKTKNRLYERRNGAKAVSFESSVLEIAPGAVVSIAGHPHRAAAQTLLVTEADVDGTHDGEWRVVVGTVSSADPYRPDPVTPKPEVLGLESATVVGPSGEEIHTDEWARVRVHFHWDRESQRNDESSCWIPTNQPWAGKGFGAINLPRIGQEVFVSFLGGDPDRPVVVGRVYTEENPVPDPLPKYKQVTGIFSEATPRMVMGASGGYVGPMGGGPKSIHGGTPMSSQQIASTVTQSGPFQAVSPTGTNHAWKGSGMKLDDMSGAENLYLQANKDLHMVVYNDWKTVVGNHRATKIGTDDILTVRGNQYIEIGDEQRTEVTKDVATRVERDRKEKIGKQLKQEAKKEIVFESKVGNLIIYAKKAIRLESDKTIELKVKNSVVKLTPEEIQVQSGADKVHINPDK
ncbi:MAG: type VI secretion system tip protein VgrG [Myxococcales bacterium]|nr:type VI secretion system tip protein VgrG [Myxococcales bacterium]